MSDIKIDEEKGTIIYGGKGKGLPGGFKIGGAKMESPIQ
jgi:hypothetical protein